MCRWFVQSEVVRTELDPRRRGSGVELRPLLVEVVLRVSIGRLGERSSYDYPGMTGRGISPGRTRYVFHLYSPLNEGTTMALRSHVCRKVPPLSCSFISRVLFAPRHISTMPRPYQFHICANWLAAPPGHGIKKKSAPFPPNTAIGAWKDHVLTLPRPGFSKTPGEDFFYVQEVRTLSYSSSA